jgi:hypothetical protein
MRDSVGSEARLCLLNRARHIIVELNSFLLRVYRKHLIACSSRRKRRSNNNFKKLRELVYERIKSKLSFRQLNRGVQQGQQLG